MVSLKDRQTLTIPCPDALGMVETAGGRIPMQKALDQAYRLLRDRYEDSRYLWDLDTVRRWGRAPATQKQLEIIQKRCRGFDVTGLTKGEASQIMNRLFNGPKKGRRSA